MPHMLGRLGWVIPLCCLCAARPAYAAEPAPPAEGAARLEALATQLSDDDWKSREKAQQELARFGPTAVPRLRALLSTAKDPDLRARLEGILKQIEQNDATGPTFVTLHLKAVPPALAFDELARQAGAKLETNPPGLLQRDDMAPVTIDIDREPFWDALRKLCATCKLRPDRSGGGKLSLAADDGTWARRPAVTSGPFLVTANEAYVTRGVRFGADPAMVQAPPPALPGRPGDGVANHTQVQVEALFEPKLHGLAWSVGNVVEASDDAGRSLLLARGAAPQRRSVYGGSRSGEWESIVWLGVPPAGGGPRRLAKLKFFTTFAVQTGVETLEVQDVLAAKDVERIVGPSRVVVKGVTRLGDDDFELQVKSVPAGGVQAWRDAVGAQFRRGARLIDAEGRELMQAGGSSSMGPTEYTAETRFTRARRFGGGGAAPGIPVKLVWDLPTGVQQFEVPVEFSDLPLP
jgi:hypothetical protein